MKKQIWAKSLLNSYKRLGLMENAINNEVNRIAHELPTRYCLTTEESAKRILKCYDKKVKLCKTKVLIDDILDKISPKHAVVLRMLYIKGYSIQRVAEYFGVSTRTIVRYSKDAFQSFSYAMNVNSMTPKDLVSYYKTEFWMCDMYYKNLLKYIKSNNKEKVDEFKNLVKTDNGDVNFDLVFNYEI